MKDLVAVTDPFRKKGYHFLSKTAVLITPLHLNRLIQALLPQQSPDNSPKNAENERKQLILKGGAAKHNLYLNLLPSFRG